MSRFSRFFLGGIIGAGVALILSPKSGREIRRMLMSAGRKQLPAPEGLREVAEPVHEAPAMAVDLEAKIEETRSQVEARIEKAFEPPPGEEAAQEEAAEAPAEAEEEAAQEEAAEAPAEEEAGAAEEAAEKEPEAAIEVTEELPPADDEVLPPADQEVLPPAKSEELLPPAEEEPPTAEAERPEETDDLAALKTPAEGEPSLEAELTVSGPPKEEAPPMRAGMDREEMRRRIDETRARLKAKAFDAMVSGETFIEEESAEEGTKKEAPSEPIIEKEVEDQIDQSLKEHD